jgi:hypothetical protein
MPPRTKPMNRGAGFKSNPEKKGASYSGFSRRAGTPPAASRKPVRDTGFSRAVRALVWARSGGYCEACGTWLGDHGGQLQHRLARRAGGSRDAVISGAANAARLCGTPQSGCHGLCEARSEHMHAAGWWLASWQDPLAEPVLVHGAGSGVTLTADGGYLFKAELDRIEAASTGRQGQQ